MMYTQNIEDLIHQLETNDRNLKTRILKDIAKLIHWATTNDLNKLTAYLLRTNDVEINFKIYVLLGLAITSNPHHRSSLAKSSGIYTKADYLLSKGLLTGSVGLFNYFTALVFVEDEEENPISKANNVAMFAKHAIRTSGCLGQMNNYFLNKFMCIQELKKDRNEEIILLVQAILENHQLNKAKFLQFHGIQCFTPELLQMSQGLHLLCTVLENCKEAIEAAIASQIHKTLQDLAHMFNVGSEVEKWRSLALFHLLSSNQPAIPTVSNNTNLQGNRPNQTKNVMKNKKKQEIIEKQKNIQTYNMDTEIIDHSFELFQQQFYRQINKIDAITKPFVQKHKSVTQQQNTRRDNFPMNVSKIMQSANVFNDTNELIKSGLENFGSMSFGDNMRSRQISILSSKNNMAVNTNKSIKFNNLGNAFKNNGNTTSRSEQSCQTSFDDVKANRNMISYSHCSYNTQLDELSFNPPLTSTPKNNLKRFDQMFNVNLQKILMDKTIDLYNIRLNNRQKKRSRRSKNISAKNSTNKYRKSCSRSNKTLEWASVTKNEENKSLITSVLNVTTFGLFGKVKSFLSSGTKEEKREKNDSTQTGTESNSSDSDSSEQIESTISDLNSDNDNSFLKESLVIIKGKLNKRIRKNIKQICEDYNKTSNIGCTTCDDTLKLMRKVNKNKHLKEIIKTLQIGVKKYGCNFKKIRQAYWPCSDSITPKDLSHLYYKIIAKK